MRAARAVVLLVAIATVGGSATLVAAPARAEEPAPPRAGACYDIPDDLLAGRWWPGAEPVPCTEPHTVEVTQTGLVPPDADAEQVARDRCSALAVWSALGVNRAVAGLVTDPLRVEPRGYTVRGEQAAWVCAAVAVEYNGRAAPTAVRLADPLEDLARRTAASLRHCSSAADGRTAAAPAVTVPCSTRPRWQQRTWVLWTALFDDFPGRAVLRERAADLCGDRAVATVPTAQDWSDGLALTRCHRRYS